MQVRAKQEGSVLVFSVSQKRGLFGKQGQRPIHQGYKRSTQISKTKLGQSKKVGFSYLLQISSLYCKKQWRDFWPFFKGQLATSLSMAFGTRLDFLGFTHLNVNAEFAFLK